MFQPLFDGYNKRIEGKTKRDRIELSLRYYIRYKVLVQSPQRLPNTLLVLHNPSARLHDLWRRHLQLGSKHPIPEATRDAEPILVIGKVVLEMVLLELPIPRRETVRHVSEHSANQDKGMICCS